LDEPYFASDTRGVHFQVRIDGVAVWAHIAQSVLAWHYGPPPHTDDWVGVYKAHRDEIDACVARRVRQEGPELVIVHLQDLLRDAH
jgi:hypothetical protein